jgi:GPH family glycoside/pentoside/hexuronide:cation symporter
MDLFFEWIENNSQWVMKMPKKLKKESSKLGYSIGSIGDTGSYSIVSSFLLYFLIDVVFLDAWLAALIYMLSYGVWNAINDPIVGVLSDKTNTKIGRRKPWIILGAPLTFIFYILMWAPPIQLGDLGIFFFLLVVVAGYEFSYSMFGVSWFSVFPELWESVEDRSKVVVFRQIFAVIGSAFAVGIFPILQVSLSSIFGELAGWTWAAAIMGAIFSMSFLLCSFGIRERKEFAIDDRLSLKKSIKMTFKNKTLLMYMGIHLMTWSITGWMGAMTPFLISHSVGLSLDVIALVMLPNILATIGFFIMWRKIYIHYGPKKTLALTITLNALSYIPCLIITDLFGLAMWGFLVGVAMSGVLVSREVVAGDVVDEDELMTGIRREGSCFGFLIAVDKFSLVIIGLLTAILLDVIIGYDPLLPDPPTMNIGIRVGILGFISLFSVILLIILKFFPLNNERIAEIRAEIEKLHADKIERLKDTNYKN